MNDRGGYSSPAYRARNIVNCDGGMTGRRRNYSSNRRTASEVGDITDAVNNNSSSAGGNMSNAFSWLYRYAGGRASTGDCGVYVRKALSYAGYNTCNTGLHNYASQSGPALQRLGFRNQIGSYPTPASAPVGSVLVYKGICPGTKNNAAGHIEIKTPQGYYSDYGSPRARTAETIEKNNRNSGRCRQLTGVWIPPSSPKYPMCKNETPGTGRKSKKRR